MKAPCSRCGKPRGSHVSYCPACYNAYKRAWYQRNKDSEYRRHKAYAARRPEVYRDSMRRKRAADPGKDYAYRKEWRVANPGKVRSYDANKRARRRGATASGVVDEASWNAIKLWYGYRCAYCGAGNCELTKDHVVPLAAGGEHDPENIAPACRSCNSRKQAMPAIDFINKILAEAK